MPTKVVLLAERFVVRTLGVGADKRIDVNVEDVRLECTWRFMGCF
jgi:hypothetical protein